MKKLLLLTIIYSLAIYSTQAADPSVSLKFGKGLTITDADSTLSFNMSLSMQSRLDVSKTFVEGSKPQTTAQVRRLRLNMKGFAFTPKLEYAVQLGFSSADIKAGIVYDAYIKYSPVKQFSVLFGQGKLPGNREELTSDNNLQFVDRSTTNSNFKLERDFGVQLQAKTGDKVVFRPSASISTGEGKNFINASMQHFAYTFRAELLPMGEFKNKGEYGFADLVREEKPKLAIATSFDFNNKAATTKGQLGGDVVPDSVGQRNVQTLFADMIFKYKGMAVAGEYAYRFVKDNVNPYNAKNIYTTGQSFWVSAGYNCKKNYETAFRFTRSFPGSEGSIGESNEYTIAFSKYIKDHSLKVQTDYTLVDDKTLDVKRGIWRFQLQIAI